eukprot:2804913-Lingulodinium_polyedra.AAC.1
MSAARDGPGEAIVERNANKIRPGHSARGTHEAIVVPRTLCPDRIFCGPPTAAQTSSVIAPFMTTPSGNG